MPVTADTNLLSVRVVEESTWGTTPATPTLQELRITADSLQPDKTTVTSNIIRSDRMVDSIIRTALGATGSLPFELLYGTEFEALLPGMMGSTISEQFHAGTITMDKTGAAAGEVNFTSTGMTFTNAQVGAWIVYWDGTTKYGPWELKTQSATTLTCYDPGATGTDVTGDANEQIDLRYIRNGTTLKSYSIEEAITFSDASQDFWVYTGMRVGGLNLNVTAAQLVTSEWSFDGKDAQSADTAIAGETVTPTQSTQPLSASTDVVLVVEGQSGGSSNTVVTEATINMTNNTRRKPVVGDSFPIDIGFGRFEVTGNLTAYIQDRARYDELRNHDKTALHLVWKDEDDNHIVLSLPQIRLTEGGKTQEGINTDIFLSTGFGNERFINPQDSATSYSAQFSLLPGTKLT